MIKAMRRLRGLLASFVLLLLFLSDQGWAFDHSHEAFTQLLKLHRDPKGLLRYQDLQKPTPRAALSAYIAELERVKVATYKNWTRQEQMAFLINAYNALTLKLIVDHYPVKSIKKIGGFLSSPWNKEFFSLLDGRAKTLDKIEHAILRPDFRDYRIHAAVNCASVSCPILRHEAYVGARLDEQLDEQMRVWLSDRERNVFDEKGARLSKIFDWYQSDFEKWGQGIWKVLEKYGPPEAKILASRPGQISVPFSYLDYDWGLNESTSAP